ncbi:Ribokinase [Mycena indigotica]|uniref:Ribokinase n=1 Tax=Mycena indigotica TaxID=2126181 RepID=A0A8H6SRT4_9AGAR|nr:Ribokinase [Mycena indigotica]KAF7303855.1 Ribokinase [Mycena indigotica]
MPPPRCLVRGSINVDEFFQVQEFVQPGQTISSNDLVKRLGGKGANQSVAIARAGGLVDFVGAVGSDGLWVKDELKVAGVNVEGMLLVKENTGRAIIQVNAAGENSIILFKGANYTSISPQKIHSDTTHMVFQNEVPLQSTIEFLTSAASSNIATVFNPSPMPTRNELQSFPWNQLTWLIVNEGEVSELCTMLDLAVPQQSTSPNKAAQSLVLTLSIRIPSTNIVCTLGADGVIAKFCLFPETVHVPAAQLSGPPLDTTGAGDCFTGYLVAGLMKLGSTATISEYLQVLQRATKAAGMCVEKAGAASSIPLGIDVDVRMNE